MSVTISYQTLVSGIIPTGGNRSGTDDAAEMAAPDSVPAAQPATLSSRTNPTAGTLTMTNADHGITDGQRIDLYWEGGACFGAIVGTVSGTSVPFTRVQGGIALPNPNTAIIVGIPQSVGFDLTGDNVTLLLCSRASANVRCYFVFCNASDVLALAILNQPGMVYVWDNSVPGPVGSAGWAPAPTNPLAGTNPVKVWVSHADTAAADTALACAVLKH